MWLKYGINSSGGLVEIEESPRGKTNLKCPYCNAVLVAKKGLIKEPHFAHDVHTCRAVGRRYEGEIPTLPLYDRFGVGLTNSEIDILKQFWGGEDFSRDVLKPLARKGVLLDNQYKRNQSKYDCSNLGACVIGKLPLFSFSLLQRSNFISKLMRLQDAVSNAYQTKSSTLYERRIDLQLYRESYRRLFHQALYLLEIKTTEKFYKIGVTTRPIEERVTEITRDLRTHFQNPTIKVLGTWEQWGCIERYFKHRYQEFNYPIGSFTEYFKFNKINSVMRDLRALQERELEEFELDILEGKPSVVEQCIDKELRYRQSNQVDTPILL